MAYQITKTYSEEKNHSHKNIQNTLLEKKKGKKESIPAWNLSQKVQSQLYKPKTTSAEIIKVLLRQQKARNMFEQNK